MVEEVVVVDSCSSSSSSSSSTRLVCVKTRCHLPALLPWEEGLK